MTIEQQIDQRVEERLNELLPQITEKLRQELIFKQTNQVKFNKKQLADRLGKSTTTIYRYMEKGLPYHYTPTGSLEFDIREVEKWLNKK
ncbi:MAG TPA: helix-turn-helix domain-containing protein [Candidatus Enterococcus avicola]|uniref:Helix-turn-helix domain-containing protein n=1 Tax=Candidatus Enterococcus avicola TaxID=2838561 RepID=A0A9D2F5W1_9ENTE|nr:helix-turn-helix domain-containing protein [Candidatus Enterococcus avicola]